MTPGWTDHGRPIDHIAISNDLTASRPEIICPTRDGLSLTDHHGVTGTITSC